MFHWFTGPQDVLDQILRQGYYISCSPSLAYSPQAQAAVRHTPVERLLIETDTPVFYRYADKEGGFVSTPKDVFRTLETYCQLMETTAEEVMDILNANARDLFHL